MKSALAALHSTLAARAESAGRAEVGQPGAFPVKAYFIEALAAFFLLSLLFDRLGSALDVSSIYALLSGLALTCLLLKQPWRAWMPFFLSFLAVIAWMWFRDVTTGSGWMVGERMLKAVIYLLGMLACTRLTLASWGRVIGVATFIGLVCMMGLIGWDQLLAALAAPLEFGMRGFQTAINRNALALPLGLLACWAMASCMLKPRVFRWVIALLLILLMVANSSRGGVAALGVAGMVMLFFHAPRKAMIAGALLACGVLLTFLLAPEYLVHRGSVMNGRDIIWNAVLQHLPEQGWIGAGRGYFRAVISPALAPFFPENYVVPFAHNIYLDWLLAYGLVGILMFMASGVTLSMTVVRSPVGEQAGWIMGSACYLMIFGLFNRELHDPLMLLGMWMIPALIMRMLIVFMAGNNARMHSV